MTVRLSQDGANMRGLYVEPISSTDVAGLGGSEVLRLRSQLLQLHQPRSSKSYPAYIDLGYRAAGGLLASDLLYDLPQFWVLDFLD
jgi:hypothetical protein